MNSALPVVSAEKIADSLVNGKTIHIEGGNFTQNICRVRCLSCGKAWPESIENLESIKNGVIPARIVNLLKSSASRPAWGNSVGETAEEKAGKKRRIY
jgi:hypothetical protein